MGKNSHVQPKYLDRDYISEQLIGIQELEIRPLKPGDFANDYFEGQFLGICLNPYPWGSYLLDYRVDRKFIAVFFFFSENTQESPKSYQFAQRC